MRLLVGAGAVGFINMEVTAVAVVFVAPVASLVVVSGVAARLVARLVVAGVDSGDSQLRSKRHYRPHEHARAR